MLTMADLKHKMSDSDRRIRILNEPVPAFHAHSLHTAQPSDCCFIFGLIEEEKTQQRVSINVLKARKPAILQHKRRRWMSEAYHQRIQKKWARMNRTAFVYDPSPQILSLPKGVHAQVMQLRQVLALNKEKYHGKELKVRYRKTRTSKVRVRL